MPSPYVNLAEITEADRDALLYRLAKRSTAEGLPATLPEWALPNIPEWARAQTIPPGILMDPLSYAQHAFPKSMQFEQISEAYWLEALSGRVSVLFHQNAVFWGRQGYIHVRVLQEHADGVSSTGMPGRPSKAKHLIDDAFKRRAASNECESSLAGEARALRHWLKADSPHLAQPGQKTVENNIRASYIAWKSRA